MNRYICIHGHFYQPPRENPWLEEIEVQDSAYPYHDWNKRITAECYAPNTAARILSPERKIIDIVNNYSKISFNFGPTLLSWIEKHEPGVYQAILDADKQSQKNFSGHGSAIAQVYNHMIMPLASIRDKRTQVFWGVEDFRHRFKRDPEGMWLAETAVDYVTLDILAEFNLKFTILAPRQAKRVRNISDKHWQDVSNAKIDPKMPYLCKLPSGKKIVVFFYDGIISQELAFGNLLANGEQFANRLSGALIKDSPEAQLVHVATDGETYGHYYQYGDMALAYCLYYLTANNAATITIYGEYLEKNPPAYEVEIFENSSWSCVHGVERWKNNCGCNSGMHKQWQQEWRASLRGAMDWLRDNLLPIYDEQMAKYINDPWQVRDEYIKVILDRSPENLKRFLMMHAGRELSAEEKIKALKLLEMQRHAMLMYTSCGWFFDEVSGIETVQIIQYAARAIQLAEDTSGVHLEDAYIKLLGRSISNITEFNNGAKIYEMLVRPAVIDLLRVGVHYAVFSLFGEYRGINKLYSYTAVNEIYTQVEAGKQKLAMGKARLRAEITAEEDVIMFVVLHLGDHNLSAGAARWENDEIFNELQREIKETFNKGDISEVMHLIDKYFHAHNYSLWHLFRDEQRQVLNKIFQDAGNEIEQSFRKIYEQYFPLMQATNELKIPLPEFFYDIAKFIYSRNINILLENKEIDLGQLSEAASRVKDWPLKIDKTTLAFMLKKQTTSAMEKFTHRPQDVNLLKDVVGIIEAAKILSLEINLWEAQNMYFSIGRNYLSIMQTKSEQGEETAKDWIMLFNNLSEYFKVKID
ncbi:MAG: DUF3536 domain-containing protein [Candidatus Omnitrophota bacterium]